jgi:hypothetical protein
MPKKGIVMPFEEPDYDGCFEAAFGLVIAEIEGGNDITVKCLFEAIRSNLGNARKQAIALIDCLGTSNWKWAPFEAPLLKESDYKKMAQSMATSTEMVAHALHRQHQILQIAHRRPYWKFKAGDTEHTPQECLQLDGVIKHYQDPFWEHHIPPCGPLCRCQVQSLSERDLARQAKKA